MRVWELAEELGVTSQEVLDLVRSYDPYVTSHLATVPRQAIDGIRAAPPQPRISDCSAGDPPPPGGTKAATSQPLRPPMSPARQPPKRRRRPGPTPVTFEPPFDDEDPYDDPTSELRYEPTWSTRDVATFFHVTPATVRQWVRRGHLTPIGTAGPSHIFDRDHILDVVPHIEDRRRHRAQPRTPPATPPPSSHSDPWDTYLANLACQLGREEFRDGRFIDALRSTLGAGTQAIWAVLVDLGKAQEIEPEHLHVLAGALFPFLDQLAAAAAEGYLEEQERTSIDFGMTRRRCVLTLIQSVPVDENAQRKAAEAARWQLPDRAGVLLVEGTDADRLARMIGADSIGATLEDTAVVVIPDADAAGRLTHLQRVVTGRRAALGSTVPLSRARESYRQAVHALRLLDHGALDATGPVVCADHLLTLILGWEEGLTDRFAEQTLRPLQQVSQGHRRTLEDTLLAWLQHQGCVVPTAECLHAHPQTVRYRLRQLRTVFGDALDDPDGRYRLETALHWQALSRR